MRYKPEAPARVDVNPRWRFGLVCGRLYLACASGLYDAIPSQSTLFTFPVAARPLTGHDESGSIPAFVSEETTMTRRLPVIAAALAGCLALAAAQPGADAPPEKVFLLNVGKGQLPPDT